MIRDAQEDLQHMAQVIFPNTVVSVAVFVLRHRGMIRDAKEDMQHIAQVIRLMSRGVDNCDRRLDLRSSSYWSVGPAWKYESIASNGQRIFSD
ncbi:hypothetical protein F383_31653 [Gossypium arboreum]|uniref:Uncharacterized protein n=1 Tax=Gossypium arboreum TaxID=29729 RepID=A0A0B0PNX4_GOSAR|nr:hypothetical protein F383_31653 [Gossypium arboreum]